MTINVELDESGKNIIIGAEWRYKELCKSIPGAKWDAKTNIWHMPVSWSGCLALRSTFRGDLEIGPRLAEWAGNEKINRVDPANSLREVTNMEEGYQDLFPHQRAGVEFLATAKRALLADEPGLGKTAQAIRGLSRLYEKGEDVFPALVVCPNTLKKNWEREFEKWWPGIRVQVIGGTAVQRRKQFESLIGDPKCPVHGNQNEKQPATQKKTTTQMGSVEVAMKKTYVSETQSMLSDNEITAMGGLEKSELSPTSGLMSNQNLESLSKSTTNTLPMTQNASFVEELHTTSTTTTPRVESEESFADHVIRPSTKQNETLSGSTGLECICGPRPHCIIVNWESLRTHSRLAPYGSVALARCTECDGLNGKVTPGRCEVHKRELNEIEFKSVIADEIHRSKDPKSKQTRALWAATGDANIRFALTGTPIANNVLDLWTILHWLSPEEWPSKTRWIDRMVDTMMNAFGGLMVMGVKNHMNDEFYAALNPRMRRMLKKVVLPWLPEVTVERRDVEMSAKQKKAYNDMRDLMIAELEGGEVLSAPSVLTQTLRLLQFASAYATMEVNPTTGEPKAILSEPSCKIDALMDDIQSGDFGEDSVAVSAVSRQLIELLSARLTKAGIAHGLITGAQNADERQQAVDDFQSGRTKWILFTAQAGGVGITLTAARRLIRLQRPWSLVDDKQVNDRVHRIGSEIHDNIIITDYVTSGTVEERVRDVLEAKADSFEQIVKDQTQLLALLKEDKEGKL